ncbi:MAG TPA: hypothetical protein PLX23_12685 [Candidatus Hydrogenedens sp.]|nr:hypothetical protein [Candidatus Hydrogenedens sp.]
MPEDYIKVKIANTDVEVPIFINQEKTNELIKKIEQRMAELTKYYQVTRTHMFALRIAYESMFALEVEKEKSKERENEIEKQIQSLIQVVDKITQKLENRLEEDQ